MEYWISHVEHEKTANGSKGAIKRVCAGKFDATTAQPVDKTSYTRARIVELLETNILYTTNWDAQQKKWKKGARVVLTDDGKYITTERTATTQDNLGALPLCDC